MVTRNLLSNRNVAMITARLLALKKIKCSDDTQRARKRERKRGRIFVVSSVIVRSNIFVVT